VFNKVPIVISAGVLVSVPSFAQIQNYKIADSEEISVKGLADMLGNPMLNVVSGKESYTFTAEQFLDYFMNKEIASVVGEEEYASFLGERPHKSEACKCSESYTWIDGKKVLMRTDPYSVGTSRLIFNSGLNNMLNGNTVEYNRLSQILEVVKTDKVLERDLNNSGYKVLLTLCDYLSPTKLREEKNKGSTCYILVDSYERAFLEKFITEGMSEFLRTLDK